MRLEIGSIHVRDVEIGGRTELSDHTLVVDPDELRALILEDAHFADVAVRVAKPGESVRIIQTLDVVEPRWKITGPGGIFPGFVSPRSRSAKAGLTGWPVWPSWRSAAPFRASPPSSAIG